MLKFVAIREIPHSSTMKVSVTKFKLVFVEQFGMTTNIWVKRGRDLEKQNELVRSKQDLKLIILHEIEQKITDKADLFDKLAESGNLLKV